MMTGTRSAKIMTALRNLVINWPPLVLFVACLVMFSGVTFVLGAYVYNTEGIPDEATLSWNKFLKSIEHQNLCSHRVPAPVANGTVGQASASVLVTASGWADQLSSDNGSLQLLLEEPPPSGLNVSLRPANIGGAQLLCVRVWGPAAALPKPGRSPPPACDAPAPVDAPAAMELILDGAGRCAGGGARYKVEYSPVSAWDITLSMAQRERAYAHLTCTSAFLAVMALCMLTCTLVRNRSRYTLAAGDKVPLSDG